MGIGTKRLNPSYESYKSFHHARAKGAKIAKAKVEQLETALMFTASC